MSVYQLQMFALLLYSVVTRSGVGEQSVMYRQAVYESLRNYLKGKSPSRNNQALFVLWKTCSFHPPAQACARCTVSREQYVSRG